MQRADAGRPGRRAVLVAGGLGLLGGCGTLGRAGAQGTVVLTTGSRKGVYYGWGQALAAQLERTHPALRLRVLDSSGSVQNLQRVAGHECDVAITTEDATADVQDPIVALARVYDDYVHVVVRDDGPLRTLVDLTGRPVAVGQPGSGVALVAQRVLDAARVRVDEQRIDVLAGTQQLARGRVDAVFWSGGLPTTAVSDLARRVPIRLLPLDQVAPAMRLSYAGVYRPATVPPGRYGISQGVPTIAVANLLVSRPEFPGDAAEALLDTIFGRRDAIAAAVPAANAVDRRRAVSTGAVRLHPAAAAYYRRTKP